MVTNQGTVASCLLFLSDSNKGFTKTKKAEVLADLCLFSIINYEITAPNHQRFLPRNNHSPLLNE